MVYAHEPDSATDDLDFRRIPPFDLLAAGLPDADGGRMKRWSSCLGSCGSGDRRSSYLWAISTAVVPGSHSP